MGSLSNLVKLASPVLGVAGLPASLVSFGASSLLDAQKNRQNKALARQGVAQLQERQAQDAASLEATRASEQAQETAKLEADTAQRKKALLQSLARQRSLYAAQGLAADDPGSPALTIRSLLEEADSDIKAETSTYQIRQAAADRVLQNRLQKNLLDVTQAANRYRLNQILESQ